MAGHRRHRMTPARRAALRKAQIASARKRRGSRFGTLKNIAKGAAVVGGTFAAGMATYRMSDWQMHPSHMSQDIGNFRKEVGRGVKAVRYRGLRRIRPKPTMHYRIGPR